MLARADVVAEARRWIDTSFAHQGRLRGVGTDCGGLVGGVAVALGIVARDWWEREFDAAYGGYSRQPSGGRLEAILRRFLLEIGPAAALPGDVLLMRFSGDPQHVGIVADYRHGGLSIIHALSTVGGVREHRLAAPWVDRVTAAFSYPGIA